MSLFKSIFDAICSKDEPKYPNGNNLDGALKRAEAIRCNMNGFKLERPKLLKKDSKNGYTTGYAGTGYYSNGVRVDDDREWYEH